MIGWRLRPQLVACYLSSSMQQSPTIFPPGQDLVLSMKFASLHSSICATKFASSPPTDQSSHLYLVHWRASSQSCWGSLGRLWSVSSMWRSKKPYPYQPGYLCSQLRCALCAVWCVPGAPPTATTSARSSQHCSWLIAACCQAPFNLPLSYSEQS